MADTTIRCGGCGVSQTFHGTESQIKASTEEWEQGHEQAVHDGEEMVWEVSPNPFYS
jgi:hypothetical protein